MKKAYLGYAILPAVAFTLVGVQAASAHGFGDRVQKNKDHRPPVHRMMNGEVASEILGLSVEELQQARKERIPFDQLLEEQQITKEEFVERMKELRKQRMQTHFQERVDTGEITQEQMNERLERLSESDPERFGKGMHKRGFHSLGGKYSKPAVESP